MTDKATSDLTDGGNFQSTDVLAVARPDGMGGYLDRKVEGGKILGIGAKEDETGTSYTLELADSNLMKNFTNSSAITVTVPPNSSVAFPLYTTLMLRQGHATGQITVAPGSGVTLQSKNGNLKSEAQYAVIWLYKIATDTWQVSGELVP